MRTTNHRSSTALAAAGPKRVSTERRTRARLRDLCDEVLASFRVAAERDLLTEEERTAARSLLSTIVPPARLEATA